MRLSLRVGSATALIILALFLLSRRYHAEDHIPRSFWTFDTTSFRAALRPQTQGAGPRKWGIGTTHPVELKYKTTQIVVPDEGIIVMGKLREEDTAWVSQELAE